MIYKYIHAIDICYAYALAELVAIAATTTSTKDVELFRVTKNCVIPNQICRTFSSPKAVFNTALGDEKVRHLLLTSSLL